MQSNSPDHIARIAGEIDSYFATVTDDQLSEDLRAADFDFYNKLGRSIFTTKTLGCFSVSAPLANQSQYAAVQMDLKAIPAGNYEALPVAA